MFMKFLHVVAETSVSLFCYGIIFHYLNRKHFVYPFLNQWKFGMFPPFVYFDSATVNSEVHLLQHTFSIVWGTNLGVEVLGHMVTL